MKDFENACLSRERLTYNHESVTYNYHFVQLNGLLNKIVNSLKIVFLDLVLHAFNEVDIVRLWELNPREQITSDTLEQR